MCMIRIGSLFELERTMNSVASARVETVREGVTILDFEGLLLAMAIHISFQVLCICINLCCQEMVSMLLARDTTKVFTELLELPVAVMPLKTASIRVDTATRYMKI